MPNLWGAITAPPSSNKSSAIAEGTAPLQRLQRIEMQRYQEELAERGADVELLRVELATAKKDAGKKSADREEARSRIAGILDDLNRGRGPHREALHRQRRHDGEARRAAPAEPARPALPPRRADGPPARCDKPGNETYRPFLLEAWNGSGSYTVDRIGRGTLHIEAHTLSILGGIQPGKLRAYIRDATSGGEGDDGLLQRFGLLVWFDRPAPWRLVDRPQDQAAVERVGAIFDAIAGADFRGVGEQDWRRIPSLQFAPDAQDLYAQWLDNHMEYIRGPELRHAPAFQAHLGKYSGMVAALALLFHLVDWADATHGQRSIGPVPLQAATNAIAWADYLELHARKLYATELDTAGEAAKRLWQRIEEREVRDRETVRTIYRHGWSTLQTADEVLAAIEVLERANIARVEQVSADGAAGGRPSDVIRLHPRLRAT